MKSSRNPNKPISPPNQTDQTVMTLEEQPKSAKDIFESLAHAKARENKALVYSALEYPNMHRAFYLPVNSFSNFYRYWLWLALEASDQNQQDAYLNEYQTIYLQIEKSDIKPNVKDQFITQAQLDENTVYTFLHRPVPYTDVELTKLRVDQNQLGKPERETQGMAHSSVLQFYMQKLIEQLGQKNSSVDYYEKLMLYIRNISHPLGMIMLSRTVSHLFSYGLPEESYAFLERFFNALKTDNKEPKALMFVTILLVRVGILLGKKKEALQSSLDTATEILLEGSHSNKKNVDAPLRTLRTILNNLSTPLGFECANLESKSGDDMLVNACLLMNPHNPHYSLIEAETLLKTGITNTPQNGDSFIEYIRCKLLQNPNYSVETDEWMIERFSKCSEHYGLCWLLFLKYPHPFDNEFAVLLALEKVIKNYVTAYKKAYDNPGDAEILKKYPIEYFHTALGAPEDFLKLRQALYNQANKQESVYRPVTHSNSNGHSANNNGGTPGLNESPYKRKFNT